MHAFKIIAMLFISAAFAMPAQDGAADAHEVFARACKAPGYACNGDGDCCNAHCFNDGDAALAYGKTCH